MNLATCSRRRLLAALFVSCSAAVLVSVIGQPTIEDDIDKCDDITRLIVAALAEHRARIASLERQLSAMIADKAEDNRCACKFKCSTVMSVGRNFYNLVHRHRTRQSDFIVSRCKKLKTLEISQVVVHHHQHVGLMVVVRRNHT